MCLCSWSHSVHCQLFLMWTNSLCDVIYMSLDQTHCQHSMHCVATIVEPPDPIIPSIVPSVASPRILHLPLPYPLWINHPKFPCWSQTRGTLRTASMTLLSLWRLDHMKPCMKLFPAQSTSTRLSQYNHNKSKTLPILPLLPTPPSPHSCPHAIPPTRHQWWKRGREGHAIDTPPDTTVAAAAQVRGRLQAPNRKTNMGLSHLENTEATPQIENCVAPAPDAAQVISTRQTSSPAPIVGHENTPPATQRDILTNTGVIHLRNTLIAPPSQGSLMERRKPVTLLR